MPTKTTIQILTGTGLIALLAGLPAGCASNQVRTVRPVAARTMQRPAPVRSNEYGIAMATDERRVAGPRSEPGSIDFSGDSTPPPAARGTHRDRNERHAALVGLYGELINRPAGRSVGPNRADGATNLIQITDATEGAIFDPDTNVRGDRMVFASTQHRLTSDIFIKSTAGRTMTRITSDPADDVMPAFAPDNMSIAFASNRAGNWDIYRTNVNGDPAIQITTDTDNELHPTWSPDGRQLAYCKLGSQSGRWEIWAVDTSQPSAPRFLEYGLFPQWNPDPANQRIVFQRARERGSRLFSVWTIDLVDGQAMHPTEIVSAANAAAMHPAWSPDGSRIVFVTVVDPDSQPIDRPTQADVWVINEDGTGRSNLTSGRHLNLYPAWGRDGTVYFLSDRSGVDNIWAVAAGRFATATPGGVPATQPGALVNENPDHARPDARP